MLARRLSVKIYSKWVKIRRLSEKFKLPARYGVGEHNVWEEFGMLKAKYKPKVNLGVGYRDYPGPKHIMSSLADVALKGHHDLHQYSRGGGLERLVNALAALYSPLVGRKIHPMNEIIVGFGAFQCLHSAISGHIDDGDEVIIIEPYFFSYESMVKVNGGVARFITLKPESDCKEGITSSDFKLNKDELSDLFNERTKMIILNTPHNPLGKVFTRKELEFISCLCKEHDVICVSDEVYEWMVYEGHEHIRMATLPDMWERTVTILSGGKLFSATGWRIGWAYGAADIINNMNMVHQVVIDTGTTPIQEAIARVIEFEVSRRDKPDYYMRSISKELQKKRDFLAKVLERHGFIPILPDGGFFLLADWTGLKHNIDLSDQEDQYEDLKFTKQFMIDSSILSIPTSVFYSDENKHYGENYARFCFGKQDSVLKQTEKLLSQWYQVGKQKYKR